VHRAARGRVRATFTGRPKLWLLVWKEIDVVCVGAHDPQLARLASAIAQRVGQQRFHVWFDNSTKLDLKQDALEIAVPNDFISEWIGRNFAKPIQDAANEVLGCSLPVRFSVVPQLFAGHDDSGNGNGHATELPEIGKSHGAANGNGNGKNGHANGNGRASRTSRGETSAWGGALHVHAAAAVAAAVADGARARGASASPSEAADRRLPSITGGVTRLRHDLDTYVVGSGNHLAYNAALHVAEFPGSQYNPLFIHGACGLGKTHLLQGLCKRFVQHHPAKRWVYLTGEEFTNEFLTCLRQNKLDVFRRKMRDLDLLVIDDVHFLGGKRATQDEFLHTFNAIEAMGKQVVIASDHHPKTIEEFGESLINRFVSGMVVRIDPPNFNTRCEILRRLMERVNLRVNADVIEWVARRVTQNVRELEGAVTRIEAHVKLTGQSPDLSMVHEALGDLERQLVAPVKPDNVLGAVCAYFSLDMRDLMSGRRQRTISLARSVAMHLIRKTAKLSFPEIGMRMGKRNHSTVISACRRMERAIDKNEKLAWTSSVGPREEEAPELVQRLEELSRSMT
jgi:chromosomal replication initiator protein